MSTPEQWPGTSPATGSATGPDAATPHAPTSASAATSAPARPAVAASGPGATPSGSGEGDVSGSGRESGSGDGSGSGSGRGPGPGSGRESEADVRYVAERLLASVREDLGRADAKAAILLSGTVALVAVLLSARRGEGLGADGRAEGAAHWAQTVCALGGGLLWAAGLVMLVAVLVPRTRIAADRTFMRDVTAGVSADVLLPKLTDSSADVVRWTLDQACALGAVLARKYAWLRWGICCLALGAIFTLFGEMWG